MAMRGLSPTDRLPFGSHADGFNDEAPALKTAAHSTKAGLDAELLIDQFERHSQTQWQAKIHPDHKAVSQTVDAHFLRSWPFASEHERVKFLRAGFSQVTCFYFPLGRPERIELACQLLTILFILDDVLENKSLNEGAAFNQRLMQVILQQANANDEIPSEMILNKIFKEMRAIDNAATDEVVANTCVFMQAQTDKSRLEMKEIGQYLRYRESDVGKALLCSLMTFTMCLKIPPADMEHLKKLEKYHARHISVVNDILSFEKERRAAESSIEEGSILCNAVEVLSSAMDIPISACEKILWLLVRQWEHEFDLCAENLMTQLTQDVEEQVEDLWRVEVRLSSVRSYIQGLRLQMSGNEVWSLSTPRYHDLS